MHLKALFIVFVCLLGVSIICDVAMVTLNAVDGWSLKERHVTRTEYATNNGTYPDGDPIIGGGNWP